MIEPGPDYRALSFWLMAAQAVGNTIFWLVGWLSLRQKATATEIKAVSAQVQAMKDAQQENCGKHQARTTTLEAQLKSAPTHDDLGKVYDRVNVVKGAVDEMNGVLKGIGFQVGLLVKHHMGEGKE